MDRTRVAAVVAVVVVLLLALLWVAWPQAEPAPPDASAPVAAQTVGSRPTAHTPAAAAPGEAPPAEPSIPAQATVLLAEMSGLGWVRCVFDAAHDAEGVALWGMSDIVWDGPVVTASVAEPAGEINLIDNFDDDQARPLAKVTWEGAHAGEQGRCRVTAPERTPVSVAVVDLDGEPVADVAISVCGEPQSTDAEGRAEGEAWLGHTCHVAVMEHGTVIDGLPLPPMLSRKVDADGGSVTVTLFGPDDPVHDLFPSPTIHDELAAVVSDGMDPVDAILAERELSPALRAWFEAESTKRAERRGEVTEAVEEDVRAVQERFGG